LQRSSAAGVGYQIAHPMPSQIFTIFSVRRAGPDERRKKDAAVAVGGNSAIPSLLLHCSDGYGTKLPHDVVG